jgi:arylformamidase
MMLVYRCGGSTRQLSGKDLRGSKHRVSRLTARMKMRASTKTPAVYAHGPASSNRQHVHVQRFTLAPRLFFHPFNRINRSTSMKNPSEYYSRQYNALGGIPDRAHILTRWRKESEHVRRTGAALRDLPYGESSGERLDFYPARRSDAPLLVFIHGGWWRSMDKSDFAFIAPAYVRAGFNVALTNYTLAPAASLAEIVQQQLRALSWLYRNAGKYDFDRERIVVSGHSAGGHLSAMMLAAHWPLFGEQLPANLVKGGVLMSGLYDLEAVRQADYVNVDLKLMPEDVALLSPAWMPQAHPAPFITAVGGLESDEFKRQNALIAELWKAGHHGDVDLPDTNHLTICDALATPGNPLFEATVGLFEKLERTST